jgi:transcriptional regulator GlxA family with amidase domain
VKLFRVVLLRSLWWLLLGMMPVLSSPYRSFFLLPIATRAEYLYNFSMQSEEIAAEVGFRCPFHFSRCFRHSLGLSPREYRRQAQETGH